MKRITVFIVFFTLLFACNALLRAQSSGFCFALQESSTGTSLANGITNGFPNSVYVAAQFTGTVTFGEAPNTAQFTSVNNSIDGALVKYDLDGNLLWATTTGIGKGTVFSKSVTTHESEDNVVVVGQFQGTAIFGSDSPNPDTLTSRGDADIFIAKYDEDGHFMWVKQAGGSTLDRPFGVSMDDFGDFFVTGYFTGQADFGSETLTSAGDRDIFVVKYDRDGDQILWHRSIGGTGDDEGLGIDWFIPYVVVTGEFSDSVVLGSGESNATTLTSQGGKDVFVAAFEEFSGELAWAKRAGGSSNDRGRAVSAEVNSSGNDPQGVFVTGFFVGSADFDSQMLMDKGSGDAFIARYDLDGNVLWARSAGGPNFEFGESIDAVRLQDDDGPQFATAQIIGEFNGAITFGEGQRNETTLNSVGDADIFIAKYNELGDLLWAKQIGGAATEKARGIAVREFTFQDQRNRTVPVQNSFIVGSFQNSVTFGTLPPTTLTAGQEEMFLARLSDFIRPGRLQLLKIPNSPFVKLTWEPPFNVLAPVLGNAAVTNLNSDCAFSDESPGQGTGTLHRVTVDYADQEDGDVNQNIRISFVPVATALGGRTELIGNSHSVGGDGFSGSLAFDVCVRFGEESDVNLVFAINDEAGNLSNYLNVVAQNPDVAADLSESRDHADLLPNSPAFPNCGASVNLIGYNIFRDNDFIGSTPAHQTMFYDEFAEPGGNFIWRVTARYLEGESEHIGKDSTSGGTEANNFFDRITDLEAVKDGGRSASGIWGDFNDDGFPDLFVPNQGSQPNFLIQNNGGMTFTKFNMEERVINFSQDPGLRNSNSASWGDFNNDGQLDLFVANHSGSAGFKNFLFKNLGGSMFEQVVDGEIANTKAISFMGVWGDYDNDGWLDLFVANGFFQNNGLYRNNRDGTFEKVTNAIVVNDGGRSFGATWLDYDDDEDLDLFVANNGVNFFYQNEGPPDYAFRKLVSADVGPWIDEEAFSQGVSNADFDNDGNVDMFISNNKTNNVLLRNQGPEQGYGFTKVEEPPFTTDEGFSLGSSWGDFDNDGDQDLYVTNDIQNPFDEGLEVNFNFFYLNNGDGHFQKIEQGNLVFDREAASGCALADFDRDGYSDLFVANGSQLKDQNLNLLYRNNKAQNSLENNWVKIKCIGTVSNRSGIGTKVRVLTNGSWQMQAINGQSGGGWGGQSSLELLFGLADATQIDSIKIEWPSGMLQDTTNVAVNDLVLFQEPLPVNLPPVAADDAATTPEDTPITIMVLENDSDPENEMLTVIGVSQPEKGSATFTSASVTYSPALNFNGSDRFTYVISDGQASSTDTAEVNITVTPVNDGPELISPIADVTAAEDSGPISVVEDLNTVFQDVDGDALLFNALSSSDGVMPLIDGAGLILNLAENYFGQASVTALAIDAETVTRDTFAVTITPLNDPPAEFRRVAPEDSSIVKGDSVSFRWTAAADVDGDAVDYSLNVRIAQVNTTVSDINDTSIVLDFRPFNLTETQLPVNWSVTAFDDSMAETASTNGEGIFFFEPVTGIDDASSNAIPTEFALFPNYPNPFNPSTTLRYDLPEKAEVSLVIYSLLGQKVRTLVESAQPAGAYKVRWDGMDAGAKPVSSGIYFYQIIAKTADSHTFEKTKKMLLMR